MSQPETVYPIAPSQKAQRVIDTLLKHIPVSKNTIDFYASDVNKACAAIINGRRVVYFNEDYLEGIQESQKTRWAVYFILAHEIAHHLNADPLDNDGNRPISELEADCQAAKVLALMGATEDETLAVIEEFNLDDTPTHPRRSARRAKTKSCWIDAKEKVIDIYAIYNLSNCKGSKGEIKVGNQRGEKLLMMVYVNGHDAASKKTVQNWRQRSKKFYIGPASKRIFPLPSGSYEITFHRVSSYGHEQIPIHTENITIENCKGYPVFVER
jgi:hypothetical protein